MKKYYRKRIQENGKLKKIWKKVSHFSLNFIPEFKLQVLAVVWMYRASDIFRLTNFFLVEPTELYQNQKNVLSGESGTGDQCHFLRSDELLGKAKPFGKKQNAPLFSFQVFALFRLSKQLHILCKEFCKSLLSYPRSLQVFVSKKNT